MRSAQFFMRISSERYLRLAKMALIFLVLFTSLCAGLHTVSDSDMGWHLATGRWVVAHRQVPRTDVLSFTSADTPWMYPPFAGVLFYMIYSAFGYAGLSWGCALACLAVVAYLVRRGDMASTVLALLAIGPIATRTAARADLFSTVFFALFWGELWAYQRERVSRLWLLPVIMLFWVNFHPGFIAGLAAIGAFLLIELSMLLFADERQAALSRLRRAWPWLASCGLATLVNPWGPNIFSTALNMVGANNSVQGKINGTFAIGEFMGVPISTHLFYQLIDLRHAQFGFTWLLLLAGALAGLFVWKRQIGAGLVVLVALFAAVNHARYSALFAITIVTLGGGLLGNPSASQSVLSSDEVPSRRRGGNPGTKRTEFRPQLQYWQQWSSLQSLLCKLATSSLIGPILYSTQTCGLELDWDRGSRPALPHSFAMSNFPEIFLKITNWVAMPRGAWVRGIPILLMDAGTILI